MKNIRAARVEKELPGYHPGNLTCDESFKHDEPPPFSELIVTDRAKPVLFDANDKPIYRKVGFTR